MTEVLPQFSAEFFIFADDEFLPEHIDRVPASPNYADLWEVFIVNDDRKKVPLALDVPTGEMAAVLAEAHGRYQEAVAANDLDVQGRTNPIFVLYPDQRTWQAYEAVPKWVLALNSLEQKDENI